MLTALLGNQMLAREGALTTAKALMASMDRFAGRARFISAGSTSERRLSSVGESWIRQG
jgi:hypothetical protein